MLKKISRGYVCFYERWQKKKSAKFKSYIDNLDFNLRLIQDFEKNSISFESENKYKKAIVSVNDILLNRGIRKNRKSRRS